MSEVQESSTRDVSTSAVARLEKELLKLPQFEIETINHWAPGMYARQIVIPKGCTLTGKRHRTEHLNVCCGDISVITDEGVKRLTGFHVIKSAPGTKRAGYAHEETIWITLHPTEETDLEKLETQLIYPSDTLIEQGEKPCLG